MICVGRTPQGQEKREYKLIKNKDFKNLFQKLTYEETVSGEIVNAKCSDSK